VQQRYTEELKKKHGPSIDPGSVPFDLDASYAVWVEVYRMGGMSKDINCLQLRFSEFITFYAFCRLVLGERTTNLESYSRKFTISSSRITTRQSATEAKLCEELRQTKELVQQLLQSNQ
jgi:hypothetical protein